MLERFRPARMMTYPQVYIHYAMTTNCRDRVRSWTSQPRYLANIALGATRPTSAASSCRRPGKPLRNAFIAGKAQTRETLAWLAIW